MEGAPQHRDNIQDLLDKAHDEAVIDNENFSNKKLIEGISESEKEIDVLSKNLNVVKNKEYLLRNELMLELVKKLLPYYKCINVPFEDNSFEDKLRGAVLLKIGESNTAFLVGGDLKEHGSSYHIDIPNNEHKIYFVCGCENCYSNGQSFATLGKLNTINEIAKANGIDTIVSRRYKKNKDDVNYIELLDFVNDFVNETIVNETIEDDDGISNPLAVLKKSNPSIEFPKSL